MNKQETINAIHAIISAIAILEKTSEIEIIQQLIEKLVNLIDSL